MIQIKLSVHVIIRLENIGIKNVNRAMKCLDKVFILSRIPNCRLSMKSMKNKGGKKLYPY